MRPNHARIQTILKGAPLKTKYLCAMLFCPSRATLRWFATIIHVYVFKINICLPSPRHVLGAASWVIPGPYEGEIGEGDDILYSTCDPQYPGVYNKAAYYMDWIEEKLADDSWQPDPVYWNLGFIVWFVKLHEIKLTQYIFG